MNKKEIENLDEAKRELERALYEMIDYEDMTAEELNALSLQRIINNQQSLSTTVGGINNLIGRMIKLLEEQDKNYKATVTQVGKIEEDLMEKGIFIGSYNLDDLEK